MDRNNAEMARSGSGTRRYGKRDSLQALRGVAALLVVISHVMRQTHETDSGFAVGPIYMPALQIGSLGVFTFFVISGYIMQYTAGGTFGLPGASSRFLRHRIARIVPTYWFFSFLAIALPQIVYFGRPVTVAGALASLAFLPDMTSPPTYFPVLAVGWSLNYEMLFYMSYALFLPYSPRIGLPGLITALIAFRWLARHFAFIPGMPHVIRYFVLWWTQFGLLLFVVGILLAILDARRSRIADRHNLAFHGALLLMAGCAALFAGALAPVSLLHGAVPVAAVALCVLFEDLRPGLASRALVWLGDRSYGLYLSHVFVLSLACSTWHAVFGSRWPLLYGVIAVAACWAACWPIYAFIEAPLTGWAKNLLLARPKPVQQAAGG